jgi:hypothetical protein
MTGEVVKKTVFGGAVAMRGGAGLAAALAQTASEGSLGTAPDGSVFLNFSGKRGVYEWGREKEDVDEDETFIVNPDAFETGWVCWKGGAPVAKRLQNISLPKMQSPDFNEFGPFNANNGEGWFQARSMIIKSVDEDDRQGYWTINSKSGVAAFSDLMDQIAGKIRNGEPYFPLIRLGSEKFLAQGQWNSKPKFTIVD